MNSSRPHPAIAVIAAGLLAFSFASYAEDAGSEDMQTMKAAFEKYQKLNADGEYAKAVPFAQKVVDLAKKLVGEESPEYATTLNNLALLYDNMDQYAKAEPLYVRALAIYEKTRGLDHPDVATTLINLAALYKTQGQHEKAEPLLKRVLAIKEKANGPDQTRR